MSVFYEKISEQKGAATVEYAVIAVLIILVIIATILWLVDPADPGNSLMPQTFNSVGGRIGNYGTVNIPSN